MGPSVVGLGRGWGHGSGVVIADGHVLTSAHNLARDEVTVSFADGRRETGAVAGVDSDLDLAVLAVDTGDAPAGALGAGATSAGIGTPVVALANPGGRGLRATLGFVSSGGRSFRGPRGRRIRGAIEHTAPLPRGSSGGPLVDPDGNLLGINSLRLDGGLILAVPADAAVKERVLRPRARRGRRRRTGSAWRSRRRGWRAACAARSASRSATACSSARVEDDSPGGGGRHRARRPDRRGRRHADRRASRRSTPRSTRCPAAGGELELTLVRGTDERTVTVDLRGASEAA